MMQAIANMQQLMAYNGPLSHQESVVAALHAINIEHGLICINERDEVCEFPMDWKSQPDGSFTFRYKNQEKKKIVKFKMTLEDEYIVIVFCQECSKESFRVTINSKEQMSTIIKQYSFTLKQYTGKSLNKPLPTSMPVNNNQPQKSSPFVSSQRPTNLGRLSDQPQTNTPKNLLHPVDVQNPFTQQQYVGPNSKLFTHPYQQQQRPQGTSPLQIPPGARYDPVDPFDDPMMERREQPGDFVMGFDEFGRPISRPRGPMPPTGNPFQGPRGGFGGGFGGSGFGGGFGSGFGGLV